MLEPLRAELGRNLVFFFVKYRIDFIEIGEYITLDDRGRITLMSLLGLADLLLKISVAHIGVICLEQSALLALILVSDLIQSEYLLSNTSNIDLF